MTIQVFTRSNNDQLYNLMRSLIPADVECIKVTGYDHWTQAADYLYHIIDTGAEWVVNVDIDCFIYDWPSVLGWVKWCEANGITHAGCRDGGELPGRYHSWQHMNPFFNIFHASQIRNIKCEKGWDEIGRTVYSDVRINEHPGNFSQPVNNDNAEPFAGFFYWLFKYGRPAFLSFNVHSDNISTIVQKAMIHTWYSREFSGDHGQRILSAFEEAKAMKDILDSGINLKQLI